MNPYFIELKKEFKRIKKMGLIESKRNGSTGIGYTFEYLIGKKEDQESKPDYYNVEIKTRRGYSKTPITLFNATPQGKEQFQIKRLYEKYSYQKDDGRKVLYAELNSKSLKSFNKYNAKIKVNFEEEKVFLCIFSNSKLIDNETFWTFEQLKLKLENKLRFLALIEGYPYKRLEKIFYLYTNMYTYELKEFKYFLNALENGFIDICIKIDTSTKGEYKGKMQDHGISFRISKQNLEKIFDEIVI